MNAKHVALMTFVAFGGVLLTTAMALSFGRADILLLVISFILVSWGVKSLAYYFRTKKWVPLSATILSIKEDWRDEILRMVAVRYFYPLIRYKYQVNEANYESDIVGFETENIWVPEVDVWGMKTKNEERFWYGWKDGTEITIYVNPQNPNESVIVKEMSEKHKSQSMALIFAGVMIGCVWLYI